MNLTLFPKQHPFTMILQFRATRQGVVQLELSDEQTGRIFAKRALKIAPNSTVYQLKMPITPDALLLSIQSVENTDFQLRKVQTLPQCACALELDKKDKDFIKFIKWFVVNITILEAGQKGTIYQSEGFQILYTDILKEAGIELTTPARIAKDSGLIEVSKKVTQNYTVPMLFTVLLHEYAHKYKNPQYGKDISNELSADIIAVNIALNLGFDPIDIVQCYRQVFEKKDNSLNRRRMNAILDFIALFQKKGAQRCKCKKP